MSRIELIHAVLNPILKRARDPIVITTRCHSFEKKGRVRLLSCRRKSGRLPSGCNIIKDQTGLQCWMSLQSISPLLSDLLRDNIHRGLAPFVNEARTLAFPLAVAESKSHLGTSFKAENRCAENAVKMLYKLSKLEVPAATCRWYVWPFFGRVFTIDIGTTSLETSSTIYRIHKMWSGDVSTLWPSLQFQVILRKLARWNRSIALNAILQSMHTFFAKD